MTFLRSLAFGPSALENPLKPLTDDTLLESMGASWGSETGISVSPEQAMRLGAVLRGVMVTSGTVGALPFLGYRHSDRSRFEHPSLSHDAGAFTPFEANEMRVAHMMLRGNSYSWKTRDNRGNILFTTPMDPRRCDVRAVKDNSVIGWHKEFSVDGKWGFTDYSIMHIPMLTLDGIKGLGPIGYARETAALGIANERAAAKLFSQGMLQRGFLTTDAKIGDEQATNLKKRWREKLGGLDNAHDIVVLDSGAKFSPLTLSPVDAQFLESRKFSVTDIARLIGMPGWMLNDQEKSTSWGTGMEQQFNSWVKVTLQASYLTRIEQRYSREILPSSAYVEFLIEGLLRGDSAARAAFYNAGTVGGWLVPNDIRPKENLPPVAWGDEPYRPYNESAAAQAAGTSATSDPTKEEDPNDGSDD
jgi:HK97 family phage portal protein